ncbi:PREDICTED: uncharacterized protein LOC109382325 isoform X2 [Hipposideros armiger]|uniref:Uncharacterized protein LOC109382325 isoform X2 n=1 Tax=Hipposideros armiger TaxID=186990 RepID=A0A8B7RCF1_HIPAR|nr:PREDICTED: uncharacterized protein LOC109382325 isoform X2 [Hipposideros armiger]
MEDFTEAKPLDIGPISLSSHTRSTESNELEEEARLPTVAVSEEKYEFHSFGISQTPVVSKFSNKLKFSKIYLQKSLFEEYKFTAAEILYELDETLQKYAGYNITFPVGIANLVNYSWHDLIEGAYKCATKNLMLKEHNALQSNCNSKTIVGKISSCSREEYDKENHLVKAKKDHHHVASSESMEKTSLISKKRCSQISQDSSLPVVFHVSLSSKICLENGWIFQHPYSKLEILKWETVLSIAVKKLQGAMIQIKTEKVNLKKEGFNKRLLRHYNDPKEEVR